MPTTLRSIRIEDPLWVPFKAKAAEAGADASTVTRKLMKEWLDAPTDTTEEKGEAA